MGRICGASPLRPTDVAQTRPAHARTLAELISDTAKPFGALAILDPAGEESLLAARPVTDVTGIAGRRERRLLPWGIRTCLDLARADRRLVSGLHGLGRGPLREESIPPHSPPNNGACGGR